MKAVKTDKIEKSYKDIRALKDISFEVEEGELFGIIGPDGAGKTTLFRVLTSLLMADSGTAKVTGLDVVKDYKLLRQRIGYMPGRFSLYMDMSVEENLTFFASLYKTTIDENYDLIKDIYQQIEPFKDRKAANLSGGMKQKLALSCALIHKPAVLFLDEPTTGVDPVSRQELWDMLKKLNQENITVVVSTPYMDEATLCDRVALMQEGQILQIDSPQNIVEQYRQVLWSVKADNMYRLLLDLRVNRGVNSCFAFGESHHVTVNQHISMSQLEEYLIEKGHTGINITPIEASIEDCYMQLAVNS